jgi:hypothetical protein
MGAFQFALITMIPITPLIVYGVVTDNGSRNHDALEGRGYLIEQAVRTNLRDPSSAQFSGMRSTKMADGTVIVCGLVNAKNSFGGYVGDELYFAKIRGNAVGGMLMEESGGAYTACKMAGLD